MDYSLRILYTHLDLPFRFLLLPFLTKKQSQNAFKKFFLEGTAQIHVYLWCHTTESDTGLMNSCMTRLQPSKVLPQHCTVTLSPLASCSCLRQIQHWCLPTNIKVDLCALYLKALITPCMVPPSRWSSSTAWLVAPSLMVSRKTCFSTRGGQTEPWRAGVGTDFWVDLSISQ